MLGERFDEEPFLIFHLRGKDQEQVLAELHQRRTADDLALAEELPAYEVAPAAAEEAVEPLEAAWIGSGKWGRGWRDFKPPSRGRQWRLDC